jgi:4-azaleucine resistance transporter AzlC
MKNEIKNGFIANLPISLSVFAYGTVLGIICSSKGLSSLNLILMNIFIFAGSAQFIIVDMLSTTIDVIAIVTAALLINIRYFLIGASLNSFFTNEKLLNKLFIMHFVTDESWAVTMNTKSKKDIGVFFLLGGSLCVFVTWFLGTMIGYYFGELISNPKMYGLDFAFLAMFIAIITTMYKENKDLIVFILTGIIAIFLESYINNMFYLIISAILGSLFYVFIKQRNLND